jgi:hypothetical protein
MIAIRTFILGALLAASVAAGCSIFKGEVDPDEMMTTEERRKGDFGTVLGGDILRYRGPGRDDAAASPIAVNAYLWRASLDTLAFMPLASADTLGGVIITDWYTPPESPNERFKTTVYILSRELRADGLRVAVFRQARDRDGTWKDAAVKRDTASELENIILTRARELRVVSVPR